MLDKTENEIMSTWSGDETLASICCITYNHENYITECIDSLLSQITSFPFEIIIHDDASTDQTRNIVAEYKHRYPLIVKTIFQKENQYSKAGLINPRFVFPKTIGKYIALCEGDDFWTDVTKLQQQVSFLEVNPSYVITYTDCYAFDESGMLDINYGGTVRDISSEELQNGVPIYTLTACFRNVIKELPLDLMPARLGDMVIWSLLGAHGHGKFLSNIKPSAYRVHSGGVFSKQSKQKKYLQRMITEFSLMSYYLRTNNQSLTQSYLDKIVINLLKNFGLINLLRVLFGVIKRKSRKLLKSLK